MKRMALGVAAMLTIGWGLSYASELLGVEHHMAATALNGLIFGVSALVGGFIARSGFVPVALGAWLIIQAVIVYILYRIAEPSGQVSIINILSYNLVTLLVSLFSTWGGAAMGQYLSRRLGVRRTFAN